MADVTTQNGTLTLPKCTFTREGYTFAGWATTASGEVAFADEEVVSNWDTGITELFAKWTAKTITITWNANGGSVTPTSSTYTYNGTTITPPTPTRTGYSFNGWFTATTGGTEITEVGTANKPTENVTYYAQWTCETPVFDIKIKDDNTVVFSGESIELTVVGSNIAANATYQWYKKNGESYDELTGQKANKLTIAEATANDAGNYRCVVTNGTCSGENNYTVKMYHIKGLTDNAWTTPFEFVKSGDTEGTFTIELAATTTYYFKLNDGSVWYWNEGTMTHNNCTDWVIEQEGDDTQGKANTGITTTASGTYTFTLNYEDPSKPKLSVTYPQKKMVYLNPGPWDVDNAKFAVHTWEGDNGEDIFMEKVDDCDPNRNIYQAEINASHTNIIFVRANPANSDIQQLWDNVWNQTSDLILPTDGKVMYDMTPLYLSPTAWNSDGAWFAAYFYNDSGNTWRKMTDSDGNGIYECEKVSGYPNVIFCRMDKNKSTLEWSSVWNQSGDLTIPTKVNNHYTVPSDNAWNKPGDNGNWSNTGMWTTYTPNHTVSFNANGHGNDPEAKCVAHGGKAPNPGNLSTTGYTFGGWYKEAGCTNAWDFENDVVTEDITLYAKWTAKIHTLTWDVNGGNALTGTYTSGSVAYGTVIIKPDDPTRTGYAFNGWSPAFVEGTTMPDNDLTYTAQWKFIPTLSWSAPTCTVTIASESNVFPTLTATPDAIKSGVKFESSEPTVATINANGDIILKSEGTTTIKAYYEEDATYAATEATYELNVVESTNCWWEEVTIDDIEYGDEVVVVMVHGETLYALPYDSETASNSNPEATTITTDYFAGTVDETLIWYIMKGDDNNFTLSPKTAINKYLTCNSSKNAVRIDTDSERYFTIENGFLKNTTYNTYLAISTTANPKDWRHFTSTNATIANKYQTLTFYKRVCLPEGQYWVKWMVNGQEYTVGNPTTMVVAGGQVVTLPTIPDDYQLPGCTSKKFIGWTTDEILVETDDAPTMFTDAASSPAINTNQTFHALFADVEGGETTYEKVTTISEGTYLMATTTADQYITKSTLAYTGKTVDNDNRGGVTAVTITNGVIGVKPELAKEITVTLGTEDDANYFAMFDGEYYITQTAKNKFTFASEVSYEWKLNANGQIKQKSVYDGKDDIRIYMNNGNSGSQTEYFCPYAAKSEGNNNSTYYYHAYLFKKIGGMSYSNYVTQCCTPWEAPTLSATTSIAVGGSTTITHSGTTHGAVTYTPSNTDIATVDANGKVTGLKPGKVTITATWDGVDGVNNYCPAEATIDITVRGSFTITYDANDALATGNTESTVIEYPDGKGTVANNGFALDGHEFVKWNTATDGSGYDYTEGASITLTDNLTLYAIWQPNQYDITVNVVGGSITLGTKTITTANTPQTITDVVAHGQSFSFTNATPDAAYETPYTVTLVRGTATVTSSSLTISNVQSDLEITIEYALKPVYTITYNIPEGGGELAADAVTSIYKGGSITLPGIKDGTISSEYSCEEFIGWTTNPANHEAAGLKPEPFYNTGASFSDVSEDVTFYPVYSRPGAGVGGTVTLTEEEMYGWQNASYGTSRDLTTCVGTWTTTGYKSGSHAIQLNSAYYIKFPELQGNITQVVLNATNGSDATLTSGTFTLKTEGGTTIASASVNGSGICTISVTGSYTTAYLYSSVTARITNIAITYGPPAIISTTLDCSSDVDECTITYDSNESFLISGASVYGSCTNSTFRFSEIGEYTICSNIRANQYVLVGWNNQCDGKGSLTYTPGQVITSLPQNNLTLYAQWAPVVSLNDAGSVSEVNATTFGGAVALPDGEKGCDPYEFVGWTTVYPSWNEESILPTIVDNPYTPTEPTTLYAVYAQRATSPDFTVNCDGGVYKIWVNNSAKNYMAGRLSSYYFYTVEWWHDGCDECEGSDGTPFTINKVGENTYTIQNADGEYIAKSSIDDEDLCVEKEWENTDRYKWTISEGTNGSWRFTNKAATSYAIAFYNNYFRLSGVTKISKGSSYYDLELTPVESAVYYSAPSCGPYSIHFYTHGGEFVQGEYAFSTAVTEGLTDPTETKFPSAELTGYTFVGWKENSPQDELTDNAPEGDTSAEPYGLKKPGSDLITTTRREYHAVYYYYDELQDIDFSAPFTTGMYAEDSNGDKHFVTGTPHDRYGGLKTTTACGDISEVTITPGTGANAGKFTISINGYSIVPANTVDLIQGNCWWTIEETSEGSGEYKIAQDTEDDRRNIVLRNSEFNYYKETGSAPDFGYGDDVFYPKFGNCREHHWASEPQRKPSIVLGTSGSMTITSSVGQTVKAANKLFVGATNYEVQTKIYLSCNVEGVELLYEDGGALSSDAIGKYLTTTAEGELATTYLILTYTPTATTDGIETVTITAQDEEGTAKATRLAQVRHLPENFVIAAKTGNSWVALTANITSTGTQAAPLIMVDNIALPTKATITPNTTKYQLLGLQTDEPSIANSRFKNNGAAVHLYSTNVSKVISASTSTDNNKTYINADAAHEGAANSPNCLFYEWQLQTNDLVHYTLVNSNTTNTSNTKLGYSATYAQWGMYQTGNNVIQEVLLLPIEKDITEMDVEVMEWGTNSMALRFGSEAPATVDITLGATSTKGLSLTNLNSGNISDIYKVEGLTLTDNECKALLITDATDDSKGKLLRTPILVNGEKNGSDYTNSPTRDVCMHSDIVILNGGKLTADEAKSVGSHVDFANIYVYPGGKLVLDDKSLGVKRQVYLRGGYSWLNSTYALPEVYVNGDINFNGSGNMIYDYYIQNQKYYQFALPYDVQLAKVTDESGADDFPVWVKHYNGALRAEDAYATSWEWYPSENGDANAYFEAGIGYIIAAKPRQVGNIANRPLSIIRFPLGNSAFTGEEGDKSVVTTAYGIDGYKAGTVTANNVGWNFIGNPFMATWKGDIGHKELAKYPDEDNWDGSYHWVDSDVKFITIMSPEDGSDYEQTIAANADLNPFFPFYLQEIAEGGSGEIAFSSDNRIKKAPAMLLTEQPRETYVQIEITTDDATDQTGMFIGNQYSDNIDFDDYEKMFGTSTDKPKVWLVHDNTRLAFEAMTENRATGMTPLGYRAPQDGEYMLVLNDEVSKMGNIEAVYLTDHETGITDYDLTSSDYKFESTVTLYNDTRFTIRIVMRGNTQGSITGIENIVEMSEHITKFIYQDKIYILHHGVIYDATGKRVITINK